MYFFAHLIHWCSFSCFLKLGLVSFLIGLKSFLNSVYCLQNLPKSGSFSSFLHLSLIYFPLTFWSFFRILPPVTFQPFCPIFSMHFPVLCTFSINFSFFRYDHLSAPFKILHLYLFILQCSICVMNILIPFCLLSTNVL